MANTNLLKTVVEKEMIITFCDKYHARLLDLSTKQTHEIFNNMEPDLVCYNEPLKILYLGEITTSGYLGHKGKDFHVGAVKKVFEAFSKFYLFRDDMVNIIERINYYKELEIDSLQCFFIVPEGSKFINALGYRKRLFENGYMSLETIKLSKSATETMINILLEAKKEIKV